MNEVKVDGPEFWGLTRLTLDHGGSLPTFNMERSGKSRLGLCGTVLKVGSLPPSLPVNQKMSLRQSAPFAAPVGLDGVFPVQREGSSLPLPVPVPAAVFDSRHGAQRKAASAVSRIEV